MGHKNPPSALFLFIIYSGLFVFLVIKKLTTEGTEGISHKGHRGCKGEICFAPYKKPLDRVNQDLYVTNGKS